MATVAELSELLLRWQEARQQGQNLSAEELCADECPELVDVLRQQIRALESMEHLLGLGDREGAAASTPPADGAGTGIDRARAGSAHARANRFLIHGYELLGVLNRGGVGVVYKARQLQLNRLVALKMLIAGPHAGPQQVERFRIEAETLANLGHPNIVQIHEVGEVEDRPYYAMEFVEGGSLADKLAGTVLPAREAAQLVGTLAGAIAAAHQRGIVHRDLKPANILLASGGREPPEDSGGSRSPLADAIPKISDFGLAKRVDSESNVRDRQTQSGAILGTPCYMAPEQAEGKTREIGPLVDVYALGAMLYEMLAGRPPFRGETTLDTLEQVRLQEPLPPSRLQPKVPRDLETICLKCLQKEPRKRYASAAALAGDLQRFLAGEPIKARPTSTWERAAKWAKRQPALAGLSVACGVAVVSLLAVWTVLTVQLQAERDLARQEQQRALEQEEIARSQCDTAEAQRARAEALLLRSCAAVDENLWATVTGKGEMPRDHIPGAILYNLACVYSAGSATTRKDTALTPGDRQLLAEKYAARAIDLLVHSQALGYFAQPDKLDRLKTDKELDPVRSRPAFRKLLSDLQKAPAPTNPAR